MNDEPLNIVCVLKSGGDFNADHVLRLKSMVDRYLTIPHRFICLTDILFNSEDPSIHQELNRGLEAIPLKHGWPGWWSKMEIFRPDICSGKRIYLDLDVVIIKNINDLDLLEGNFFLENKALHDYGINSSVMLFDSNMCILYRYMIANPGRNIKYHIGDQQLIIDLMEMHYIKNYEYFDFYIPGEIVSYKREWKNEKVDKNIARIVYFHGKPRPWECDDEFLLGKYNRV